MMTLYHDHFATFSPHTSHRPAMPTLDATVTSSDHGSESRTPVRLKTANPYSLVAPARSPPLQPEPDAHAQARSRASYNGLHGIMMAQVLPHPPLA
eukprot:2168179-Rhodomonas_salina.2